MAKLLTAEQLSLLIEIDNASEWDEGRGDRPGLKLTRVWSMPGWNMPRGTNRATLRRFVREGLIKETNVGFYVITETGIAEVNR